MTWRTISDTEIDSDSPITQTLMFALRDNQEAIAQGLSGSKVVFAGWHPYDLTSVGGSEDGVFYDFSVDGAVSSVETPAFADGYEYAIAFLGLSTASSTDINIDFHRETDAAYTNAAATMGATNNAVAYWGVYALRFPRMDKYHHNGAWIVPGHDDSAATTTTTSPGVTDATLQSISKARVRAGVGNFDAGQLVLLRRREYFTG